MFTGIYFEKQNSFAKYQRKCILAWLGIGNFTVAYSFIHRMKWFSVAYNFIHRIKWFSFYLNWKKTLEYIYVYCYHWMYFLTALTINVTTGFKMGNPATISKHEISEPPPFSPKILRWDYPAEDKTKLIAPLRKKKYCLIVCKIRYM